VIGTSYSPTKLSGQIRRVALMEFRFCKSLIEEFGA